MTSEWPRVFINRLFGRADNLHDSNAAPDAKDVVEVRTSPDDSNLVLSRTAIFNRGEPLHLPVLDIDYDAHLIESSTFGHYHLYLNKPVTWENYVMVLVVLAQAGLIEEGFAKASIARGFSTARLPWVRK